MAASFFQTIRSYVAQVMEAFDHSFKWQKCQAVELSTEQFNFRLVLILSGKSKCLHFAPSILAKVEKTTLKADVFTKDSYIKTEKYSHSHFNENEEAII